MPLYVAPPPDHQALFAKLDGEDLVRVFRAGEELEEYVHWDKLRHLDPPDGITREEWWLALKLRRQSSRRVIPLASPTGMPFYYTLPDEVLRLLHFADQRCSGEIAMPEVVTADGHAKRHYLVNSLMEEAIRSSQLEGATTSRRVAKELLRTGRNPQNRSERMILNNYRALHFMRDSMGDTLTPAVVLELRTFSPLLLAFGLANAFVVLLINPWRTVFDGAQWLYRRLGGHGELGDRLPYPEWLGTWPACLLLLAFSWIELVYPNAASPAHIAWLAIAYSILTWTAMLAFGGDTWLRHGEVFSLVFGTLARFAPTEARDGKLLLRPFVRVQTAIAELRDREEGQTITEYALIIASIAILLIIAMLFLAGKIDDLFSSTGTSVANPGPLP